MTKTKKTTLKWRLADRPSVNDVATLLVQDLVTKDEAREILFSAETQEIKELSDLQEEVKFLRGLVDKLAKPQVQTVIREVERLKPSYWQYDWYKPYYTLANTWVTTTGVAGINNGALHAGTTSIQLAGSVINQAQGSTFVGFSSIK